MPRQVRTVESTPCCTGSATRCTWRITVDQPTYDREDVDFAAALTAQIAAGLAKADHVRQIERLAYSDQLTGLANRRSFDTRPDAAFERHARDDTIISLIMCDANGLKRMNDTHGRDHGDVLLAQLAGAMSAAAATLPGSLAARLSDDTSCVLVEDYGPTTRSGRPRTCATPRSPCAVERASPVGWPPQASTSARSFRARDFASWPTTRSATSSPRARSPPLSPAAHPERSAAVPVGNRTAMRVICPHKRRPPRPGCSTTHWSPATGRPRMAAGSARDRCFGHGPFAGFSGQDWMNASRSGLSTSACVVSMPCG